jgi:hypothetical protein
MLWVEATEQWEERRGGKNKRGGSGSSAGRQEGALTIRECRLWVPLFSHKNSLLVTLLGMRKLRVGGVLFVWLSLDLLVIKTYITWQGGDHIHR